MVAVYKKSQSLRQQSLSYLSSLFLCLSMRLSVALCPPFLTVFLRFCVFRFCFRVCSDFVVRVFCPCCSVLCHHAENEVLFKLHVQVTRDERGAHFD